MSESVLSNVVSSHLFSKRAATAVASIESAHMMATPKVWQGGGRGRRGCETAPDDRCPWVSCVWVVASVAVGEDKSPSVGFELCWVPIEKGWWLNHFNYATRGFELRRRRIPLGRQGSAQTELGGFALCRTTVDCSRQNWAKALGRPHIPAQVQSVRKPLSCSRFSYQYRSIQA